MVIDPYPELEIQYMHILFKGEVEEDNPKGSIDKLI